MGIVFFAMVINIFVLLASKSEEEYFARFMIIILLQFVFWIIYILVSIALVLKFINNLMSMSKYNVKSSQNVFDLTLNSSQEKMVNLSAKYLSLFAIAASLSAVPLIMTILMIGGFPYQLYWCSVVIDVCINIICLLLQYGYMNSVYLKYCYRIDACCKRVAASQMRDRVRDIVSASKQSQPIRNETEIATLTPSESSQSIDV